MTAAGLRARRATTGADGGAPGAGRPLFVAGALGALVVTLFGVAVITAAVLVGWIAAPHARSGLAGVLRTAAVLWLVGNHVGLTLRGTGRVGMLPLGLVLLPGFLLWRAGACRSWSPFSNTAAGAASGACWTRFATSL